MGSVVSAVREHDEVRMLSRNDLDLGGRYAR